MPCLLCGLEPHMWLWPRLKGIDREYEHEEMQTSMLEMMPEVY